MENDDLLHKWVNGTLSADELNEFKLRPEYESLVTLKKNTDHLSIPEYDEELVLSKILGQEKKSDAAPEKERRVFLATWMKYGVAASVLFLAAWFFWPSAGGSVIYELAKGEKKEGILPDGSIFALNAGSRLSYDPASWEEKREVALKGEAFFEVKKGSQFKVLTPNGMVQVLGTKFNVRSRKESLEVKCQEGKVAVLSVAGKVIIELVKTEAVRIASNEVMQKWTFQPSEKASWVEGLSRFDKDTPLAVVLEELERQYNIKVDASAVNLDESNVCKFKHDNLESALKAICEVYDLSFEINDGKVLLLRK